jgi:hypothetical protein
MIQPFLILIFSAFVHAHVIQDDVSVTERSSFSFAHVCSKMVTHEAPLIDAVSGTELDCMGKRVNVADFCEKEMAADPYYLRGSVSKTKKEVVCVSGKKVLFKYLCVKKTDAQYCGSSAKESCEVIQKKLARRLDMVHFSYTQNDKGIKQLNCFFEILPLKERTL